MSNVFDNLQSKMGGEEDETGISVMALASLPPAQRKIMRMLLREMEMTYPALCEAFESLPGDDGLTRAQVDEAMETLEGEGWVIKMGTEGGVITYAANLRRKPPKDLPVAIWGMLGSKIRQTGAAHPGAVEDEKDK